MPVPLTFLASAIGPGEMALVFAAALLLFGSKRIPEIARTVGKVVSEMRRASREFQDQIMRVEEPPPRGGGSDYFVPPAAADTTLTSAQESTASVEETADLPPLAVDAVAGTEDPNTRLDNKLTHVAQHTEPAYGGSSAPDGCGRAG